MTKKRSRVWKGEYYGNWRKPFVLAEMSGNHNHNLERGLEIIEAAAKAGADGVKLQTYTADTLTLDIDEKGSDFWIEDSGNQWNGISMHQIFKKAYTPWEWHEEYFNKCAEMGLWCISTAFDESAVDFLETLNVPFYKIASFENNHLPLIAYIAKTGKPIILSNGMASLEELVEAVRVARDNGCKDLTILQCTSAYPSDASDANLATMAHMRESLGVKVGLSDHSPGIGVAVAASALGACVIEKHLTINRADGGVDSNFSMEPDELSDLVIESERAHKAIGSVYYGTTKSEESFKQGRRSIYITRDAKKGTKLTKENIRVIRPGYGMHPRFYELVLGSELIRDVKKGDRLSWGMILKNH